MNLLQQGGACGQLLNLAPPRSLAAATKLKMVSYIYRGDRDKTV